MKTLLYMGITINGYIAKADGDSQFTSEEDLKSFFDHSKNAGNIIMGKNTFIEASKQGYFPFPEALNVVLTHEKLDNKWGRNVLFTDKSPKDVLAFLKEKGFDTAFIAGGGKVNSSFIKEKLIDEIYIDVEPVVFGRGIPIFAESDFEFELKLLETKKLNENTIQLHYQVIK
ncbi:dihydrofolate reductase [Candidatus Parcubacteria bacterium]|nr:dihydrofolate reductase [Candidatus Parcubacteria bacterium]